VAEAVADAGVGLRLKTLAESCNDGGGEFIDSHFWCRDQAYQAIGVNVSGLAGGQDGQDGWSASRGSGLILQVRWMCLQVSMSTFPLRLRLA
jgi:hypothetical protein